MYKELEEKLIEMSKEQLISYINLMLNTIMVLEDRLQGVYKYVDAMSFESVIDNPKKDLYMLLKGEEVKEKDNGKRRRN